MFFSIALQPVRTACCLLLPTYAPLAGGVMGQAGSQTSGRQGPSEGAHAGTVWRGRAAVMGDSCVTEGRMRLRVFL